MLKLPRTRHVGLALMATTLVYGITLHGLSAAFRSGGVNGFAGKFVESTWGVWYPAYVSLSKMTPAYGTQGGLLGEVAGYLGDHYFAMLDEVAGARRAQREWESGKILFAGVGMSAQRLWGIDEDTPWGCEVTWTEPKDRDGLRAFLGQRASILDRAPTDVPPGHSEIKCNRGRIVGVVFRGFDGGCIVASKDGGFNQRMVSLVFNEAKNGRDA